MRGILQKIGPCDDDGDGELLFMGDGKMHAISMGDSEMHAIS